MAFTNTGVLAAIVHNLKNAEATQKVSGMNLSNARTPGYKAKELNAQKFKEQVTRSQNPSRIARTNPKHLSGTSSTSNFNAEIQTKKDADADLSGNTVNREEELLKINQSGTDIMLMSKSYGNYMGFIRKALSIKG